MTVILPRGPQTRRAPRLSIAFVGPARFPIREPYAGGLEAFCHTMVKALRIQGHDVDFFAAKGSDGNSPDFELPGVNWGSSRELATDTGYPEGEREREDRAFISLRQLLVRRGYDVVHNNSLSPWMFPSPQSPEPLPMVTTLHTPRIDELSDAIARAGDDAGEFAAVSHVTAADWTTPRPVTVIPNGVNVSDWTPGPGGTAAVWFGRLVPEKAPHLAIDACRLLGLPLLLAGRKGDHRYFQEEIAPRLNGESIRWLGELSHAGLRALVGSCAVTVVTPRWEEPFGLVAFESMACGTPVAAFAAAGSASCWPMRPPRWPRPTMSFRSPGRSIPRCTSSGRPRASGWWTTTRSSKRRAATRSSTRR